MPALTSRSRSRTNSARSISTPASEQTLRALFIAAGLNEAEAERLADTLADWRDADDQAHPKGAEREKYEAEGYRYPIRNAPFESVSELGQVAAMQPQIIKQIASAVTVHTRQPFVDPATASTLSTEVTIGRVDGQRSTNNGGVAGTTRSITDLSGRTFTVTASYARDGIPRRAMLRFTGQLVNPFLICE